MASRLLSKGPSIKFVTLFWTNFDPHPCHTLSHISRPPYSTSHISEPQVLVVGPTCIHARIHMSLQGGLSLFAGFLFVGFCPGFLSGWFCLGWFLSVPLLSAHIRYTRKLNITFNFRFQMYEK